MRTAMASKGSPPLEEPEAGAPEMTRGRGRAIASWLAGALSILGFVGMILAFREKIRTGHGGDTYRTATATNSTISVRWS